MIPSAGENKPGRRETEFDLYVKECDEKIASIDSEIAKLKEGAKALNRGDRS